MTIAPICNKHIQYSAHTKYPAGVANVTYNRFIYC